MRATDLSEAAGHLQTALMLFVQGRRTDREARAGAQRIRELVVATQSAHAAGDTASLEQCLRDILAIAESRVEKEIDAGSRFTETRQAIAAMSECLTPTTNATPRSSLREIQ